MRDIATVVYDRVCSYGENRSVVMGVMGVVSDTETWIDVEHHMQVLEALAVGEHGEGFAWR